MKFCAKCDIVQINFFIYYIWSKLCSNCFKEQKINKETYERDRIFKTLQSCIDGDNHDLYIKFGAFRSPVGGGLVEYKDIKCKNPMCKLNERLFL